MMGGQAEQTYALSPIILTIARPRVKQALRQEIGGAPMTAAPELRDWTASFARRTRTLGGGEITAILALAGASDVITFSGGFPDPATFPAHVLADIAGQLITEDPGVALQYSATEGLAGMRDYVAGRLASREG